MGMEPLQPFQSSSPSPVRPLLHHNHNTAQALLPWQPQDHRDSTFSLPYISTKPIKLQNLPAGINRSSAVVERGRRCEAGAVPNTKST